MNVCNKQYKQTYVKQTDTTKKNREEKETNEHFYSKTI